jgi:putative copper resistance protein D
LLVESEYGRLLLAKLALFGAMLGIAAVNRWRLAPQLGVSAPIAQAALRRLRRLAWFELLVGVAVLIVASVLATSAPPMPM